MHLWRVIFRQVTFVLLAALAVGEMARIVWPQRCPETAELAGLRMVSAINARALWGDSIVWVDARPRELGQRAPLAGALPLSMDDWDAQSPAVRAAMGPDKRIVVYCDCLDAALSAAVARRLQLETGNDYIYVLAGRFDKL